MKRSEARVSSFSLQLCQTAVPDDITMASIHEQPDVEVKVFTADLDDLEEPCEEGHSNGAANKMALDDITKEQLQSLLVESMSFLNNKCRVERERERNDRVEDRLQREEYDRLADLLFGMAIKLTSVSMHRHVSFVVMVNFPVRKTFAYSIIIPRIRCRSQ